MYTPLLLSKVNTLALKPPELIIQRIKALHDYIHCQESVNSQFMDARNRIREHNATVRSKIQALTWVFVDIPIEIIYYEKLLDYG